MGIKKQQKTVYTCSDGKEFTDKDQAKAHEFDVTVKSDEITGNPRYLREWLTENKNTVLDFLGTEYDPEPERQAAIDDHRDNSPGGGRG